MIAQPLSPERAKDKILLKILVLPCSALLVNTAEIIVKVSDMEKDGNTGTLSTDISADASADALCIIILD